MPDGAVRAARVSRAIRQKRGKLGRDPWRRFSATVMSLVVLTLLGGALVCAAYDADAQGAPVTGEEVAQRLQRGVDNPEQEKNIYRSLQQAPGAPAQPDSGSAVTSVDQVKQNMRKLYRKLLVTEVGGEVDKAYNPHLRDAMFSPENRQKMANARSLSGAIRMTYHPLLNCFSCSNAFGGSQTACSLCNIMRCPWTIPWFDHHIHWECCPFAGPVNTGLYQRFTRDTNFKSCCVRKGWEFNTEEQVACKSKNVLFNPLHAFNPVRGDGWAGMPEVDFWTNAIGLENNRAASMIATQGEVLQCLAETETVMQSPQTAAWISGAIGRNAEWAEKAGGGGGGAAGPGGAGETLAKVQSDIAEVRPSGENAKLRFSDSLGSEGITVRPNLAVMENTERVALAKRFCFRPEQFLKLMNPVFDPLQRGGGADWRALAEIPLWANYCLNGATLMTDPKLSKIENVHRTPTDFIKGMEAWERDPLYCQRIQATQNANFRNLGLDKVLEESAGAAGAVGGVLNAQAVGYTCMEGGKLNNGMVPVTFLRNNPVERRTAIADKLFSFLIAGTLVQKPSMLQYYGLVALSPFRSYLKGFEPRPYSLRGPQFPAFTQQTFIGKQFAGRGTNELGDICLPIQGNNYQFQNRSDQLYISDYTHKPFTQEILVNSQQPGQTFNLDKAFNKYVQQWAKGDMVSQKAIATREIERDGTNKSDSSRDKNVSSYASTSRIVALCPLGYTRWRPPPDHHNAGLVANMALFCREENFGSPTFHLPFP